MIFSLQMRKTLKKSSQNTKLFSAPTPPKQGKNPKITVDHQLLRLHVGSDSISGSQFEIRGCLRSQHREYQSAVECELVSAIINRGEYHSPSLNITVTEDCDFPNYYIMSVISGISSSNPLVIRDCAHEWRGGLLVDIWVSHLIPVTRFASLYLGSGLLDGGGVY